MGLLIELFDYAPLPHVNGLQSVEVYEGQSAQFSCQVKYAESVKYQTSVDGINWVDVAGATNSTYTISNTVRTTHDSKMYRVVASNRYGQRISNSVMLNVWNPLALGSGLVAWMDPTFGVFVERTGASASTPSSNNGLVGTWRARNGSINAVAAADNQRGIYRTTGLNNAHCIDTSAGYYTYNFSGLNSAFRNAKYGYMFIGGTHVTTNQGQLRFSIPEAARFASIYYGSTLAVVGKYLNSNSGFHMTTSVGTSFTTNEVFIFGTEMIWYEAEGGPIAGYTGYSNFPRYIRKNSSRTQLSHMGKPQLDSYNITGLSHDVDNSQVYSDLRGRIGHIVIASPNTKLTEQEMDKIEGFIKYKINLTF